MPITSISNVTPLSRDWTHEDIFSHAMILTGQHDNEQIDLENVRRHINLSISHIAGLSNIANRPWYGTILSGTLEGTQHSSGLDYIDLSQPVGTIIPANYVSKIIRASFKASANPIPATDWVGNLKKWDISKLTNQLNELNNEHRHTVAWEHFGGELLVFTGKTVSSTANPKTTIDYNVSSQTIVLFAHRKPILDNMYAPNSTDANNNYRSKIDLPDDLCALMVKMVQQYILSQVREQVPAQLTSEINQGLAAITQIVAADYQYESAERNKAAYGQPQLPAGGTA